MEEKKTNQIRDKKEMDHKEVTNDIQKNRTTMPTKGDRAPFGFIVQVLDPTTHSNDIYIQLSQNENLPDWKPISYLLECVFKEFLNKKEFIEQCLLVYKNNQVFNSLGSILKNKNNL